MPATDDSAPLLDGLLATPGRVTESELPADSAYFLCERCYDPTAPAGERRTRLTCSHPDAPASDR